MSLTRSPTKWKKYFNWTMLGWSSCRIIWSSRFCSKTRIRRHLLEARSNLGGHKNSKILLTFANGIAALCPLTFPVFPSCSWQKLNFFSVDTPYPLISNYTFYSSFVPNASVCANIHQSVDTHRPLNHDLSNRECQLMWLKLWFASFIHYFCVINRSHSSGESSILNFSSSDTEYLLITNHNGYVTILGNFIVHNRNWLVHTSSCGNSWFYLHFRPYWLHLFLSFPN